MIIAVLALLVAGAAIFRELVKARCWAWGAPTLCRVETEAKAVALTFDDGPSPRGVAHVLPLLAQYDAKATFFLIGQDVARHPGLAASIAAAGHEIGNHSFTHRKLLDLGAAGPADELDRTDALLRQEGVDPSVWVRPPNGVKFFGLARAVEESGRTLAMWDVEEPSAAEGAQAYADALLAQVRPGSIILIHPMVKSRDVEREALPLVLQGLKERGYAILTLSQLAAL